MTDLISRSDTIKAMCAECELIDDCGDECTEVAVVKGMPSVGETSTMRGEENMRLIDADALYKRVTDLWNVSDNEDFEKGIFKLILNAPTIEPSKLNNPCGSLLTGDSEADKEQKSKLDCISRERAIEALCDKCVYGWYECGGNCEDVVTVLRNLPPVTPTERTGACKECRNHKLIKAIENRSKQNRADIRAIKAKMGGDTK